MERIHQLVQEHRRLLAATFAGLAVLAALTALRPSDGLAPLLVARHDLSSGHPVTADDVRTARVPASSVPEHALGRDEAIGRRVAGPMRAGEAMTDVRVVRPGSLAGYGADAVLTTILVDPVGAATLGVGDRVDVVAVDPGGESPAEIVARDVEIVTVPAADEMESAGLGVVTTEQGALALAEAGLAARLSVITTS
ncbi:MAG: SAF domain-containing protein [Aeromicrobium sp.]